MDILPIGNPSTDISEVLAGALWENDVLHARVKELQSILHARHSLTCGWREDEDGNWQTDCGECYVLIDGNPDENDYRFCPSCGRSIAITKPKD